MSMHVHATMRCDHCGTTLSVYVENDDSAVDQIFDVCDSHGWSVEPLGPDYCKSCAAQLQREVQNTEAGDFALGLALFGATSVLDAAAERIADWTKEPIEPDVEQAIRDAFGRKAGE